ncbi:MAG: hypothetical protein ACMXYE_00570 [Candidatus Woesearchaeota archaeon]
MEVKSIEEKTNLKNVDELNTFFEISSLKNEDFLLREIRRKIVAHLEMCLEIFSKLVSPDGSLLQSLEAQSLSDNEREKCIGIIRSFGSLLKDHILLEVESNDDAERIFCNTALTRYKEHLPEMNSIIQKVKSAYTTQGTVQDAIHYLG